MNNWFRSEIQIRPPAYSRMEALAQQKACQGKDVCSSNTTGSPNTAPVESDSTTPCQRCSQAPEPLGRLHLFSIIKEEWFLKNWDRVFCPGVPLTELDVVQTFIFVLAHSVRIGLCKPMGANNIKVLHFLSTESEDKKPKNQTRSLQNGLSYNIFVNITIYLIDVHIFM